MKKMKALALLCALALTANSQPYGQKTYNNTNPSKLSCGKLTSFTPQGFLMAGYVPSTGGGGDNFYIVRTTTSGGMSGPAFSQAYQVYWNNCINFNNQELKCYGVDVTECSTNLTAASYYLAVATDNGCWFEGVDNSGNTISSLLQGVQFPSGAWGITAPKIIESTDTPGEYYVAGAYITSQSTSNTGVMYIFKVDGNGTVLWNQTYTGGGSTTRLWPTAIIESPYATPGSPELAVFGNWYSGPGNLDHEGFYVTINAMNGAGGNVLIADHYGVPVIGHEDRFFAATVARSNASGGPGYAIGGFSAGNATTGSSWMLKISPSGGPVQWSNAYQSSWGATDVVAIAERQSVFYGNSYEYYGAAVGPISGMVVMKLDANGNPFSQPSNINNDFLYTAGTNPVSVPTSISYLNTGASGSDVGIHVYGTDNTSTGKFYLVEAAFNGQSGCGTSNENLTSTSLLTGTGPNFNGNLPIKASNGLGTCSVFKISNSTTGVSPSSICGISSLPASANNRSMATGIAKNSMAGHLFSVYPNPSGDRVQLSGSGNSGEPVKVELMNALGQLIAPTATGTFDNSGSYSTEFDLHALGLEAGIYFARIHANGTVSEQKILYTK